MIFTPASPAAGKAMRHVLDGTLRTQNGLTVFADQQIAIAIALRNSCFSEIFLRKDIGSDLRPLARHFDIVHFENWLAIRIAEHARTQCVFELIEGANALFSEETTDFHTVYVTKKTMK